MGSRVIGDPHAAAAAVSVFVFLLLAFALWSTESITGAFSASPASMATGHCILLSTKDEMRLGGAGGASPAGKTEWHARNAIIIVDELYVACCWCLYDQFSAAVALSLFPLSLCLPPSLYASLPPSPSIRPSLPSIHPSFSLPPSRSHSPRLSLTRACSLLPQSLSLTQPRSHSHSHSHLTSGGGRERKQEKAEVQASQARMRFGMKKRRHSRPHLGRQSARFGKDCGVVCLKVLLCSMISAQRTR